MNTAQKRKFKYKIISIISILGFLIIWYLATAVLELAPSYSLPSPFTVFSTFLKKFYSASPDGSTLVRHFLESLKVTTIGYLLGMVIGVPLGIAMGWIKWVDRVVRPVFDLIKPIPPIALIPIMVVLLGIGLKAKSCSIFFATVVPCIVNSYSGIRQTRQIHLWVSQTFGASNPQQLLTVALPSALPMIFAGLRVAMGSSWMALVAAELLASTSGIGYMISIGRALLRSDLIIVGILCLGLIGTVISISFDLIERKFIRGDVEK
jgi:NitT/TauT family transport system permease protein/taurine transport system permease protein